MSSRNAPSHSLAARGRIGGAQRAAMSAALNVLSSQHFPVLQNKYTLPCFFFAPR